MDVTLYILTLVLVLLIGIAVLVSWWFWWQLQPAIHRGGPYVPSTAQKVQRMIALAKLGKDDVVYDLGSGDGRLVFAAVKHAGCRGVGIEIDPWLVNQSRKEAEKLGLGSLVRFVRADLWKSHVHEASVVFLFQIPLTMKGLEKKLRDELKPGARVVSNHFVFPTWKPNQEDGEIRLYVR